MLSSPGAVAICGTGSADRRALAKLPQAQHSRFLNRRRRASVRRWRRGQLLQAENASGEESPPAAFQRPIPLHSHLLVFRSTKMENCFSKLQRGVIDRTIVTSVADLKHTILRYIRRHQKTARPFRWKYPVPPDRIPAWSRQPSVRPTSTSELAIVREKQLG